MDIRDLLSEEAIFISAPASTKAEAIDLMISLLKREGRINDDVKFREEIFGRESEMSTDIFEGIAIPHAKSSQVNAPSIAALTIKEGLNNSVADGEPVKLMFMLATPKDSEGAHIEMLSRLSKRLLSDGIIEALRSAKNAEEFLNIMGK